MSCFISSGACEPIMPPRTPYRSVIQSPASSSGLSGCCSTSSFSASRMGSNSRGELSSPCVSWPSLWFSLSWPKQDLQHWPNHDQKAANRSSIWPSMYQRDTMHTPAEATQRSMYIRYHQLGAGRKMLSPSSFFLWLTLDRITPVHTNIPKAMMQVEHHSRPVHRSLLQHQETIALMRSARTAQGAKREAAAKSSAYQWMKAPPTWTTSPHHQIACSGVRPFCICMPMQPTALAVTVKPIPRARSVRWAQWERHKGPPAPAVSHTKARRTAAWCIFCICRRRSWAVLSNRQGPRRSWTLL
mmetsp:Transcript_10747/g.26039  ORF Transcript_10747/g.26039 Transcript_10747/m.26039 type:complete len:300 (+) Transcript_10747:1830-2729(+)